MAKFTTQDATLAQLDFKWVKLHTCVPKGQVLSLMSKQRMIIDTVLSTVLSMAQITGIFAAWTYAYTHKGKLDQTLLRESN